MGCGTCRTARGIAAPVDSAHRTAGHRKPAHTTQHPGSEMEETHFCIVINVLTTCNTMAI